MSRHKGCRILVIEPVHRGSSSVLLVFFWDTLYRVRAEKRKGRVISLENIWYVGIRGEERGNMVYKSEIIIPGRRRKSNFFTIQEKHRKRRAEKKSRKALKVEEFWETGLPAIMGYMVPPAVPASDQNINLAISWCQSNSANSWWCLSLFQLRLLLQHNSSQFWLSPNQYFPSPQLRSMVLT